MNARITQSITALLALSPLSAMAQQVTFTSVGPIPTLSRLGIILLGILVAGAAIWLTRKRGAVTRLFTLAALASGTAYLASHIELIGQTWAGADAIPLSATQSPVLLTPPADGNRYLITNNTGSPIIITALVDESGTGCLSPNYYDVYPLENYQIGVPACAPNLTIPAAGTCTVEITCVVSGS